ncbi:ATP-binding protein [Candidatus Nitrospira allomarina]|uniref:histidine kinase n=1 Tax=Candidatus Nitrospira allomarina TaxID=3020900 RepID=A0AA96G9I9_9BACT|nr:ATP-binding protein [Candidatus Nitrospira allomarina]WNM57909.1 ATP-binding protein [Candidatus Nitrospira allomarina]
MSVWVIPSILTAGVSLFLATIIFVKRKDGAYFSPLLLLMIVMIWIHGLNGILEVFPGHLIIYKKLIFIGEVLLPVLIGFVGFSLLHEFSANSLALGRGWWKIIACGAALLAMVIVGTPDGFMQVNPEGEIVFRQPEGLAIWGFIVLVSCVGIFQLERILQSFPDPLRYRLKYVLIGLGGLACISIAQAFHLVVVSVWRPEDVWAGGLASFSSLVVMALGLRRWRGPEVIQKIQISHQALYASLVVVCVSGYFVLVAMVTVVVQQTDWEVKESLGMVLMFLAVMGLVVAMLSRRVRVEFQQVVSRHFFKAKYDYREKWLEVTETFSACQDVSELLNRYLEWLSRTFGTSRVTIWKRFDVDGRYHQIRKERRRRKLTENDRSPNVSEPIPIPENHPLIHQLKGLQEPLLVQVGQREAEDWKEFLDITHAHVCVPLVTEQGRLLGFCTLSQESVHDDYDQDDLDLLRAIAHHVTMLLIQFELVEERSSSAKWEAVHRFSAFYLHDLKNLASSLSMVAQNAAQYGSNIEFQASAMQTVKSTSQRIIDLMGELSRQANEPNLSEGVPTEPVDVNLLIKEILAAINGPGCQPNFSPGLEVPVLQLKREAIKQVLLNLILNARQAIEGQGTIDISTAYDGKQVIVELVDSGGGMSVAQLENIFQPFKSSKKNGLGVGLFQCKRIVEDHHGVIHIESQEGQGTTVMITFPVQSADNASTMAFGVSQVGVEYDSRKNK